VKEAEKIVNPGVGLIIMDSATAFIGLSWK